MSVESVLGLVQLGAVGIMLGLFVLGFIFPRSVITDMKAEVAELKQALQAERDRADAAVAAAQTARDLISALQMGMNIARKDTEGDGT